MFKCIPRLLCWVLNEDLPFLNIEVFTNKIANDETLSMLRITLLVVKYDCLALPLLGVIFISSL